MSISLPSKLLQKSCSATPTLVFPTALSLSLLWITSGRVKRNSHKCYKCIWKNWSTLRIAWSIILTWKCKVHQHVNVPANKSIYALFFRKFRPGVRSQVSHAKTPESVHVIRNHQLFPWFETWFFKNYLTKKFLFGGPGSRKNIELTSMEKFICKIFSILPQWFIPCLLEPRTASEKQFLGFRNFNHRWATRENSGGSRKKRRNSLP